ncbi:MAG: Maf family protein, partial [Verrucomicrobiales bacterium]|nr:Maf family protein [Verrucomicrobiales bacterium]
MPASPSLILASGSPRRSELLNEYGFDFTVVPPDVEEIEDPEIPIEELTRINAKLKAEAISEIHGGDVVLAADTLVLLDGRALGKPADLA